MTAPMPADELTVFRWSPEDDSRLTELVSLDEHSFSEIGRMMKRSKGSAIGRFKRLRDAYGWQAR